MTRAELIEQFIRNHQETVDYINQLNDQEFVYREGNKWSAGQQLKHILLTIVPFPKVLSSKAFILEKFGTIERPSWSYETVLENYSKTSLKAPESFLPDETMPHQKKELTSEIAQTLERINALWDAYSEEALDRLALPHPLLGMLTIREMFYLMGYHPLHHLKQIKELLKK